MTIFTKAFWYSAAERAIKTAAQTAVSVGLVGAAGVLDVDWTAVGSVSGLAALVSLLTSVASDQIGNPGPSLAGEVVIPDPLA